MRELDPMDTMYAQFQNNNKGIKEKTTIIEALKKKSENATTTIKMLKIFKYYKGFNNLQTGSCR